LPDRKHRALVALAGIVLLSTVGAATAGTLSDYRLLVLDDDTVKWGTPERGTGAVVTYAVASRAATFEGARNCSSIVPVDDTLAESGIARPDFNAEVAAAFRAWSAVADIAFEPAPEAAANIVIGSEAEPRGWAFTNVAHRPATGPGESGTIVGSVICLNPGRTWKIGFDGNLNVYDVRYTLMHEIGHAIGLDHPGVPGEVMDFRYEESFSSLQAGDRAGAVDLYGPRIVAADARLIELSPRDIEDGGLTLVTRQHGFSIAADD
jgi:hypothetical protein